MIMRVIINKAAIKIATIKIISPNANDPDSTIQVGNDMARSLERYVKFFALREIFWNFFEG